MLRHWKKSLWTLLAVLAVGSFTACSDDTDDDPDAVIPTAVAKTFMSKYPNASRVEWTQKGAYYVADFKAKAGMVDVDAWFTASGEWAMTENDYAHDLMFVPGSVSGAFAGSPYGTWTVDDVEFYEYPDASRNFYLIEVEKAGQPDTQLYYVVDANDNATLKQAVSNNQTAITPDTKI